MSESSYDARKDTLSFIAFAAVIFGVAFAVGYTNMKKGDAILACMADKGDVRSEAFYGECVDEYARR